MDKISEDTKLFVLKLIMNYIPPKTLAILSTVHSSLQRNAASLFRTETRNLESQEIVDLETSDFSDIGRCYFFIPSSISQHSNRGVEFIKLVH